ncbi:MAG: carboxylating nicotinate-nucleotide diphosphorylase [Clostridiales bacterium]|nr:carboxylating nicotinate-nucleotide diphosphorylase [Clostridiales bacterium]
MDIITLKLVADKYIKLALEEDINSEDISTNSVIKGYKKSTAQLICKQDGVIAGLNVFERVFKLLDENIKIDYNIEDGQNVKSGDNIGTITGDIRIILSGERTALNYLQHMSGIATYTKNMLKILESTNTKLLDTRKTTPCMRIFEKYAVKVGGGYNHRYNLSNAIMLKDNHISAVGGIKKAIEMAREYASHMQKIEVEVENLKMVKEAVECGADIIMLDNMSIEEIKKAIEIIDKRAKIECSGNVSKENIKTLANLGIDYISSGALTHSAPILDISLKNLHIID